MERKPVALSKQNVFQEMMEAVEMGSQGKDESRSLSEAVITAVAEKEGKDPLELEPPLFEAVDPEALNDLFQSESVAGRVRFQYLDYTVMVGAEGKVVVED